MVRRIYIYIHIRQKPISGTVLDILFLAHVRFLTTPQPAGHLFAGNGETTLESSVHLDFPGKQLGNQDSQDVKIQGF